MLLCKKHYFGYNLSTITINNLTKIITNWQSTKEEPYLLMSRSHKTAQCSKMAIDSLPPSPLRFTMILQSSQSFGLTILILTTNPFNRRWQQHRPITTSKLMQRVIQQLQIIIIPRWRNSLTKRINHISDSEFHTANTNNFPTCEREDENQVDE